MTDQANGLLAGKRILIMGVANKWSIAYAIGEAMKAAGATLILSYLDERMLKDCQALVADQPEAKIYPCNAASDADIAALSTSIAADYGTIDGFVHAVGFAPADAMRNRFIETTREAWQIALDVSAFSLVAVSAAVAPLMTNGGSIQTLTYLGADRVFPNYRVMGVAKAALESAVRYLAYDLGEQRIRVNALSAGPVKTAAARGIPGFMDMYKELLEHTPLKTDFGAEQVAGLAVFLASDLSSAITGETIFVDNGFHAMGM
ncbi:MAG TPA: enoyl-ACP reductase [Thermomicrobiales bacterium]|nr:enoyl-ACP reductase [Thermomicrobiales bacterium]